jgi:hypothetical protein
MSRLIRGCIAVTIWCMAGIACGEESRTEVIVPADRLEDQIHGGMLGQILGNLNGLPHEMKYIDEPGNVERYVPALPDGARTDDDTDLEWVYVMEMQKGGRLYVPEERIVELWKAHVNRGIWCANLYSRKLMDLGIAPPLTGRVELNPWSNFNISGSFCAETFALASPHMPKTASQLAMHYTSVTISGEPKQLTQFVVTMISVAFGEPDMDQIIDAGLEAVDRASIFHEIAADLRTWVKEHPDDWRATRRKIRDKYTHYDGEMADRNGHELNTAATIAALLYGKGDFVETLRLAFNFGWDCDNNAATCGTILGVIKGRKWMDQQGWVIRDAYRNTTRDGMPPDESISRFGQRVIDVARLAIRTRGGVRVEESPASYVILGEKPANVAPLNQTKQARDLFAARMGARIEDDLSGEGVAPARAAYLAICLGEADRLRTERPDEWAKAIEMLKNTEMVRQIFEAPRPAGPEFQAKARAAGLEPPAKKQ